MYLLVSIWYLSEFYTDKAVKVPGECVEKYLNSDKLFIDTGKSGTLKWVAGDIVAQKSDLKQSYLDS